MLSRQEEPRTDPDGAGGSTHRLPRAPDVRKVLSWVFIGRLGVVTAFVFRLDGVPIGPAAPTAWALPLLLFTALFTAASYANTRSQRSRLGRGFLYTQVFFDAILLTVVVFATGGQRSMFAPLYILVIAAGALLLPMLGGILTGLFASVLYFTAAVGSSGAWDAGIVLQAALFAIVALVTGYLADRLRQTGAALGEVETELRLLRLDTGDILNTIGTGVLTVDGEGRLAYMNPAAAEILSLAPAEWIGRPVLQELDRIAPGLGEVIGRSATSRTPIRRFETEPLDAESFILGVSTTLLERSNGAIPPVTAIFQDITEKMRAEGLRRRAERLEAVAELSASLAHEIKNPLASIRSAVEQIAKPEIAPDDARLLRSLALRESDRLSRLLGEFIDFARVKVTAPNPVDFSVLVRGVVDVVRAHPDTRERSTRITYQGPDAPVWIRGAEDLLHRAVLNLALNAVQWAGDDGEVALAIKEVRSDLLSPALGALRLVRLTVTDTGPGVPEEIREDIFDPFFTRRPGGTGLGLALVQRAVEAHGGAIFADNAPGKRGAIFALYLPTLPPELRPDPGPAPLHQTIEP